MKNWQDAHLISKQREGGRARNGKAVEMVKEMLQFDSPEGRGREDNFTLESHINYSDLKKVSDFLYFCLVLH